MTGRESDLHPVQLEALRKMTPTMKWEQVLAFQRMAREVRSAAIRAAHPEWPASRVAAEVARQILLASS